jgi:membrane protein implicated in regulation of membrane protease activity
VKKAFGIFLIVFVVAAFLMAGCSPKTPPASSESSQGTTSDAGKTNVEVAGADGKTTVTTDGEKSKVEAEGKDGSAKVETDGDNAKVDVTGTDGSVKIDTTGGNTNMVVTGADGNKVVINTGGNKEGNVTITSDKGKLEQKTGEEAAKDFKVPFFPGAVAEKAVKHSGDMVGEEIKENRVIELTTDASVKDVKAFYVKSLSGAQVVDTGDNVVINLPSKDNPAAGTTVAISKDADTGKTKVMINERAGK